MFDTCQLVRQTYESDDIGQRIPTEKLVKIFCEVGNITRSEFFQAGQSGLNPELKLDVFYLDYNGEKSLVYKGNRYKVYRTYQAGDTVEIYCERAAGV